MTLEKGIVLKTIDYQENSKILYIMTAKGLKSAIVRGAKSLRSKTFSYAQSITYIEFNIQKERYIDACNVINYFNNIKLDYRRMMSCLKIVEISYTLGEHITDYNIFFNFLVDILMLINDNETNYLFFELVFKIKILYLLGVAPVFSKCVSCGSKSNIVGFAFNNGGMKCKKCIQNDDFIYPKETINSIKNIYLYKLNVLTELIGSKQIDYNYEKIDHFLRLYYSQYLGFNSKINDL